MVLNHKIKRNVKTFVKKSWRFFSYIIYYSRCEVYLEYQK
ncbi:hypothetical protein FM106_24480 [Brachybacterium faecium]|nr:hypothetical protein FM106_24480 [Brachybacterium faecium]